MVVASFTGEAAWFDADLATPPGAIATSLRLKPNPDLVSAFANQTPILITRFASDLPTAQEAALKIKEGT